MAKSVRFAPGSSDPIARTQDAARRAIARDLPILVDDMHAVSLRVEKLTASFREANAESEALWRRQMLGKTKITIGETAEKRRKTREARRRS